MRKAIVAGSVGLAVVGVGLVVYIYIRYTGMLRTARETALAEVNSGVPSPTSLAVSLLGQGIAEDLALTPDQERQIERLRANTLAPDPTKAREGELRRPAEHDAAGRLPAEYRRREVLDSVRAALSAEQWTTLEAHRAPLSGAVGDWQAYARSPFAANLLRELDLTAAQKDRIAGMARLYAPRVAALMVAPDLAGRGERLRALLEEAWEAGRAVLTADQRTRLDRYLATHRREVEAGLTAMWLQGL